MASLLLRTEKGEGRYVASYVFTDEEERRRFTQLANRVLERMETEQSRLAQVKAAIEDGSAEVEQTLMENLKTFKDDDIVGAPV